MIPKRRRKTTTEPETDLCKTRYDLQTYENGMRQGKSVYLIRGYQVVPVGMNWGKSPGISKLSRLGPTNSSQSTFIDSEHLELRPVHIQE